MDRTQNQTAAVCKSDLALSIIFCGALILGCLSLAVRMGTRVLMKLGLCNQSMVNAVFFDNVQMQEAFANRFIKLPTENTVNWKELYPLSSETEAFYEGTIDSRDLQESNNLPESEPNSFVLQIPKVATAITQLNTWLNEQFIARYFFINTTSRIKRPLGVFYEDLHNDSGKFIRLPNGHFTVFRKKIDTLPYAKSLIRFNEFLSARGIPLLYVQAPCKNDPADTSVSGKLDFANQRADELLYLIDGKVDYLDLRDEMQNESINHYDSFYITDHHWKTETAFWATRVIIERLNADFQLGLDTEVLNPENFNFEVMPESFLGSYGRAVTLVGADMEDFTLITPKANFELEAEIYPSDYLARKASGGFEVFIFPEMFQTKETAYSKDAYHAYLKNDSIIFVKNNSIRNEVRLLVIGDSFGTCVKCFLPLCVKDLDAFDLRYQKLRHFNGSLSAFIDAHERYDACIMLVNPSAIGQAEHFDFR